MDKQAIREATIAKLKNLSKSEREEIERNITTNLINSDRWKKATTIGITISNGFEWNTKPIIETAWEEGKKVCIPKCEPKERKLIFYQFDSYEDQLKVVYSNLLEPIPEKTERVDKQNIDLLIVPGLTFDKEGYRIGFGGGYYDRFLADFTNQNVSLVGSVQLIEHVPKEEFDIPVAHIITENGTLK